MSDLRVVDVLAAGEDRTPQFDERTLRTFISAFAAVSAVSTVTAEFADRTLSGSARRSATRRLKHCARGSPLDSIRTAKLRWWDSLKAATALLVFSLGLHGPTGYTNDSVEGNSSCYIRRVVLVTVMSMISAAIIVVEAKPAEGLTESVDRATGMDSTPIHIVLNEHGGNF